MSILPIYVTPHPVLRQKAAPVAAVDKKIQALLADMTETLEHLQGVGLAANQVGVLQRILVINADYCAEVDGADDYPKGIIKMVNPEITWKSDEMTWVKEGCFSVPTVYTDVERPAAIHLNYLDEKGNKQTLKTVPGLFNACIQHEIDHLDGVLFPDQVSKLKQKMIDKKYSKAAPDFNETLNYKIVQGTDS